MKKKPKLRKLSLKRKRSQILFNILNTSNLFLESLQPVPDEASPSYSITHYLKFGTTSWLTIKFWTLLPYHRFRKNSWFIQFYRVGESYISLLLTFWYWAAYWDEENRTKFKWLLRDKFRNAEHEIPIDFALTYGAILPSLIKYLFFLTKKFSRKAILSKRVFFLYLLSRSSKIRVFLLNESRSSLFFLSSGIITSLTKRDKKSKKTKLIRILLFKYVQKLLLFSRLIRIIPTLRRTPIFWHEMIQILNSDIQPFFREYLTNLAKTSSQRYFSRFIFPFLIYQYPTKYSKSKMRNTGRIKRKIRRKLVRASRIDI